MKDHRDRNTIDLLTGKPPVGRPRKYADNAEKMRLYRKKKRAVKCP